MSRHSVEVEVDLSDFDDAAIIERARYIIEQSGRSSMLGGGPETPAETMRRLVHDLARAMASDDRDEAFRRLHDLVGNDLNLVDAIDTGRRAR